MSQLEKQVLNFFCILEIALGLWMIISPLGNENVIRVIELYSPLWLLGIIFILGGAISLFSKKKYFWLYVLLVSVPLSFFGLVFVQVTTKLGIFTSSVIVYNFIGIYSAAYAGQVYKKQAVVEKILVEELIK